MAKFIGTQYYRPPNPAPEDWERDLNLISKCRFKIVRTWLFWSQVNPQENLWNFSSYDRFVELAKNRGLEVLIQLVPESAPQWFIDQHPDAMLVRADGSVWVPEAHGMVAVGGYPGLSPDVPEVKKAIEHFLVNTVSHYKEEQSIYAYDVWNEIMPYYTFPTCLFHKATQHKFREWLKRKYGSLEALNKAWGSWTFTSWNQVHMPQRGTYITQLDVHLFHREWLSEHLSWRVSVVKRTDPKARCVSHAAGGLEQITKAPHDPWMLSECVDVWGTSDYETDFYRSALFHNVIRSSAQGKPWWLSEQAGGRTWTLFGDMTRTPEFVEQKMIQAFSYGAEANLVWQWRPERFGQESPNFGLVNEDGSLNDRTRIISRLAKALEKHQEIFANLKFDEPDIGLVIDWRLRSFEYSAFNDPARFGEPELLGWHSALTDLGANVEVLNLEKMVKKGISSNLRLLILPVVIQDFPGLQESLERFVENGGFLVVGPYFLTYDIGGFVFPDTPPKRMRLLFGAKRVELLYPKKIEISLLVKPLLGMNVKGYHILEVYDVEDAEPFAHSGGFVTATLKPFGKGYACRLGTFLGSPYVQDVNSGLRMVLGKFIDMAGCSCFPRATNVVTRMANSGQNRVLFVSNPKNEQVITWLKLPDGCSEALDLVTNKKIPIVHSNYLTLNLAARESKILLLR